MSGYNYFCQEIFTLPEISIMGGSADSLTFNLEAQNGAPYNAEDCTVTFDVIEYADWDTGIACLTKNMSPVKDSSDNYSTAKLSLSPGDTEDLSGKFIYQITIDDGVPNVIGHGIMMIAKKLTSEA